MYISRWEGKLKDGELRLKWFLHNYTPDIPRDEIRYLNMYIVHLLLLIFFRRTVNKAFNLWSSQITLKSVEVTKKILYIFKAFFFINFQSLSLHFEEAESEENADITILWAEGDHGDAHMVNKKLKINFLFFKISLTVQGKMAAIF